MSVLQWNEDGALFCEQCKSDISNVAPTPAAAPPTPTPMPESLPPVEEIPMAAVEMSDEPVMAAIVEDVVVAEMIPAAPVVDAPTAPPLGHEPEVVQPVVEVPPAPPAPATPVPEPAPAPVAEVPPAPPAPPAPVAPVADQVAAVAVSAPAPAAPAKPAAATGTPIPPGAAPKLVVQRGLKVGDEYPIFAGENFVGRADEKPVDVDLTFQEPEDRVWCSRQHALLVFDEDTGSLTIEDLNSSNGTFVNRERVYPGQPRQLFAGNTIQIGTVHMKIKV